MSYTPPSHECLLCPRLASFRADNRIQYPNFFNGPVPSFGSLDAQVLVVGLAPGLKGANQTGRPFTGDYAGLILYKSLLAYGFAKGDYQQRADDGLELKNCRITNAVRCVPQQNKPEPSEIRECNAFLAQEIKAMPNLKVLMTLGLIAHKAVLMALGLKQSSFTFGHGAMHRIGDRMLLNSYHCSRYNINTGTLTQAMFDDVVKKVKHVLTDWQ